MKKSLSAVLAVTALLGAAAGVQAAPYAIPAGSVEMNIYGASAQFGFWNAAAKDLVTETVANGGLGCASRISGIDTGGKTFGIVIGKNCAGITGNKDVVIRYSSKASYDGIYAVKGTLDTDSCGNAFQRKMTDETQLTDSTTNSDGNIVSTLKCVPVTLGASDVAGESFTQSSSGQTAWNNATPYKINGANPNFTGIVTNGTDGKATLLDHKSLVVPFAFYVNSKVTVGTCSAAAASNADGQCRNDADCGGTASACVTAPLSNISRAMAVQIFSGQAINWTDFGAGFAAKDVVACLRHAGSGTHATLDKSVMYSPLWGSNTNGTESLPASATSGAGTVFNVDTGTELGCVANYDGGIGYADADSSQLGTTRLKYNGVAPKRSNLRNGLYDTFYTYQHLFENAGNTSSAQKALRTTMLNYVNIHAFPATKADFWATAAEMNWGKSTDAGYPSFIGAATPIAP
jgi:ABC-type phosphate transport system substrate-binding protein